MMKTISRDIMNELFSLKFYGLMNTIIVIYSIFNFVKVNKLNFKHLILIKNKI